MMNMELQHKHDFRAKLHIFATIGITLSLLLFAGIASLFLIEIEDVIYADGKITSELPVEVVGIVDGRILKLNVDEGDDVRKGEVLAQIDATKYEEEYASIQSAIHELEAELEVKRAGLEALKANPLPKELWYAETNLSESRDRLKRTATRLERLESLRDKHAISQHEYENAEIEFIRNKAEGARAEENLRMVRGGLGEKTVEKARRDLAAAIERYRAYHFDKMFYVVSAQQSLHFQQLFKTLELMGYTWARNCVHIPFCIFFFCFLLYTPQDPGLLLRSPVLLCFFRPFSFPLCSFRTYFLPPFRPQFDSALVYHIFLYFGRYIFCPAYMRSSTAIWFSSQISFTLLIVP